MVTEAEHLETKFEDMDIEADGIEMGDEVCFTIDGDEEIDGEVIELNPGAGMGVQDEVHIKASESSEWERYGLVFRRGEQVSANGLDSEYGGEHLGDVTALTITRP